jgi:hypothetical protein
MPSPHPGYYTPEEAHAALGCHRCTLSKRCKRAGIKHVPDKVVHPKNWDGRFWYYMVADIEHLAELHGRTLIRN